MRLGNNTRRKNKNRNRQFYRQKRPELRVLAKAIGYELFGIKPTDEAEERFALAMAKGN